MPIGQNMGIEGMGEGDDEYDFSMISVYYFSTISVMGVLNGFSYGSLRRVFGVNHLFLMSLGVQA